METEIEDLCVNNVTVSLQLTITDVETKSTIAKNVMLV